MYAVKSEGVDKLNQLSPKTGTTIIGLICKDAVIIAADKRVTLGDGTFIAHSYFDKIFKITDRIAVATAGGVSDVQLLVKLTKAELRLKQLTEKRDTTVKEAANLFATLTYQNIRRFSPLIAITSFIIGGVDSKGKWLFNASPDGALTEHKDYVASGSGMILAYGVLDSEYKQDMQSEEAIKLAVKALKAAMGRDTPTGSGIDVIRITEKGIEHVVREKVKEIIEELK